MARKRIKDYSKIRLCDWFTRRREIRELEELLDEAKIPNNEKTLQKNDLDRYKKDLYEYTTFEDVSTGSHPENIDIYVCDADNILTAKAKWQKDGLYSNYFILRLPVNGDIKTAAKIIAEESGSAVYFLRMPSNHLDWKTVLHQSIPNILKYRDSALSGVRESRDYKTENPNLNCNTQKIGFSES